MEYSNAKKFRRLALAAPLVITLGALSACGDNDANDDVAVMPDPAPTPTPTPAPMPTSFDVTACLNQTIPGTSVTVAQAVVPDTLTLNLSGASGFPNGRKLADPVIDVTLAVIFLDLSVNGPGTLAGLPLNPPANDKAFSTSFPYLASVHGTPPTSATTGTSFNFRTNAPETYTRVDRMGMPAVATALVSSGMKEAYNDASPADDAEGTFVPDIAGQLTGLTNALADDLVGAGLTPCATES